MSDADNAVHVSSGVEALIQRLRHEGVASGRAEAEKIVADAETRAGWILKQAEEDAQRIRKQAREEAGRLERSGREALNAAARDALLTMKAQLNQRFAGEVRRLVGGETRKKELLEKMILEVVGQAREYADRGEAAQVLLPREVIGLEELSRHPEEMEKGELTQFVRLINGKLLREGVTLGVAEDEGGGLRVQLTDQGVVLDLSDEAIAEVLLQHLQPRFRALLEGIVK